MREAANESAQAEAAAWPRQAPAVGATSRAARGRRQGAPAGGPQMPESPGVATAVLGFVLGEERLEVIPRTGEV